MNLFLLYRAFKEQNSSPYAPSYLYNKFVHLISDWKILHHHFLPCRIFLIQKDSFRGLYVQDYPKQSASYQQSGVNQFAM
jgi:hypothetical protein